MRMMMNLKYLLPFLNVLSTIDGSPSAGQLHRADCTQYTMMDDKTLLDNYKGQQPGQTAVVPDWYRMNASAQGVMVGECPRGNVCGTSQQAWLADSYTRNLRPTPAPTTWTTASVNCVHASCITRQKPHPTIITSKIFSTLSGQPLPTVSNIHHMPTYGILVNTTSGDSGDTEERLIALIVTTISGVGILIFAIFAIVLILKRCKRKIGQDNEGNHH